MIIDLMQLPEDDDKVAEALAKWEYIIEAVLNKKRAVNREYSSRRSKRMQNQAKKRS